MVVGNVPFGDYKVFAVSYTHLDVYKRQIDRYQESVAMGLTARQLIFSIASVVVGGGIVLLLYKYIGLTGSAYVRCV